MGQHALDSFAPVYTGFKVKVRENHEFKRAREIIAALEAIAECASPIGVTFVGLRGIMERGFMGEGAARRALAALVALDALRFFWVEDARTHERLARMIVSPCVLHIRETLRGEAMSIWESASKTPISIWKNALKNVEINPVMDIQIHNQRQQPKPEPEPEPEPQPNSSTRLKKQAASPLNGGGVDATENGSSASSTSASSTSASSTSASSTSASSTSASSNQAPIAPPNPPVPPPPLSPARHEELIAKLQALGTSRRAAEQYVNELGEHIQSGINAVYAANHAIKSKVGYAVMVARTARAAGSVAASVDPNDYTSGPYSKIFDYPVREIQQ